MSSAELSKFEIANTQHKVVNVKFKQELMGYLLHVDATWLVCCRFKSSQYHPIFFQPDLGLLAGVYKVYVFWEGHKNWQYLHRQFDNM